MIGFIVGLLALTFLFWLGFTITGALLSAFFWLFIKLPVSLILIVLGVVCCCTIILIPLGLSIIKFGCRFMIPGCLI